MAEFITLQYAKTAFGVNDKVPDDKLLPIIEAANNAVENAIRAKNPQVEILDGTEFFAKARDVAMVHLEASILKRINRMYREADQMYQEYEKKLDALIEALWEDKSPRRIQETFWEEDLYRPFGQDFGVPIDY